MMKSAVTRGDESRALLLDHELPLVTSHQRTFSSRSGEKERCLCPTPLKTIIPEREKDENRCSARRVEVVVLLVDLRESLIDVFVV